jgi:hypothetical protein
MEFLPLGTPSGDTLFLSKRKAFSKSDKQLSCRLAGRFRAGLVGLSQARERARRPVEKALRNRGWSALPLPPSLALKGFPTPPL